jgi:hypothetical protein
MRVITSLMCMTFLMGTMPQTLHAQDTPAAASADDQTSSGAEDQGYSSEQLDALLAPIALYPDPLLTQILMASTFSDEIPEANKWVQDPAHKSLTGDALDQALEAEDWDPSVKSLVPFPQVLETMSSNIDWTNQLGYAMSVQQSDVLASVQRLRKQAQDEGQLKSTEQQTVSTEGSAIIIQPAQPNVVYVPSYNPTVVYGAWPYPAYPPVYYPPPYGYYPGAALATGLAFGAGIAITAGLFGWAGCGWNNGSVNVNVNRYNNINANRGQIKNSNWNANRSGNQANRSANRSANQANRSANRGGGRTPPSGPVGRPSPQRGMPANSIGRSNVGVPGNITKPPSGMGAGNRQRPGNPSVGQGGSNPSRGQGGGKPQFGQGSKPQFGQGAGTRPSAGGGPGAGTRPSAGSRPSAGTRPSNGARPSAGTRPSAGNRANSPGAFNGMSDGRSASQYGNRGAQSQRASAGNRAGGGSRGGAGRGGGGGGRGGGGRGGGGRR